MTYCGRPSAACHACREKRGKCDKRRPGCGQCARKHISCSGYRDPSTVIIRDQTMATVRRVLARRRKKGKEAGEGADMRLDQPPLPVHRQTAGSSLPLPLDVARYSTAATTAPGHGGLALCMTLSLAPEDAATAFFLSFYAPTSPMAYLSTIANASLSNMLLTSAMLAPALAMLSHELGQPSLMGLARKNYAVAIKETNAALASPQSAMSDATLASVLLLALFEAVAFQRSNSPSSWTLHVDGAVELIKLRGARQFDSAVGRALFLDVSNNVSASCAQRRVATPVAMLEMRAHLSSIVGDSSPEVGLGYVADSMANLLARMTVTGVDRIDPVAIVRQGCQLNTQISQLMEQLEELFPYEVVSPADALVSAYNNVAHQYQTPQAARHWNVLRMMRLFVNKWVHRAATSIEDVSSDRNDTSDTFCRAAILEFTAMNAESMAIDILGSVPFFQCLPSWGYSNRTMARWLIWPLSAVALSMFVPVSAQIYARNSLQTLGKCTGIQQAAEAINMVDEKQSLEDWLHLCHLS